MLSFCDWVGADVILPSCTTVGTTLATANTSVNTSCVSIALTNVVVQGNMTLNVSISGIVVAKPGSPKITVTISNMTLRSGAILAIDSRGYTAPAGGGGPLVSIMIQSLIGNDGCLVFIGSFPPGTLILVSGAQMVSSTAAAPLYPELDPYNPSRRKIVMLVTVSLTSHSSIVFVNSSIIAINPTSIIIDPFCVTGGAPMAFANRSALIFYNCTVSSLADTVAIWNSVSFNNFSYIAITASEMTSAGTTFGSGFWMEGSASFSTHSYIAVTSCKFTVLGGWSSFGLHSTVAFSFSSYLTLISCNLTSSGATGGGGYAFYIFGTVTFTNFSSLTLTSCSTTSVRSDAFVMLSPVSCSDSSYLALSSCTLTGGGGGHAVYVNSATFTSSSYLALSSCNITSGGGGGYSANAFYMSSPTFTSSSYLALSLCNLTAGEGGHDAFGIASTATFTNSSYLTAVSCSLTTTNYSAFYMGSATFTNSSYLALSSCTLTGGGIGGYAFYMGGATFTRSSYLALSSCTLSGHYQGFMVGWMTVDGWSYVVAKNSRFTGTIEAYPPVTLGSNRPLVIGNNSWVLWKGNVMTSVPGYSSCIKNSVNFSSSTTTPGTISMLDNNCTCGPSCLLWAAPFVSVGGGGKIYQRCNTVNGTVVPAGSPLLPTGTMSAGACGSCNVSADCFVPLTVSNSTCSINSASRIMCQCLAGGGGMCLPLYFPPPMVTATVSPSSEIPSVAFSASASRTTGSRSPSEPFTISSLTQTASALTPSRSSLTATAYLLSDSPTAVSSPSVSASTFVCNLDPAIVLDNTTSLSFSIGGSSLLSPVEGLSNGTITRSEGGVVTVLAGGSVPMASVLAAAGFMLHVAFVATAGYSLAEPANMSTSLGNVVRAASRTATHSAISSDISVVISLDSVQIGELSAASVTRFTVSVDAVVSPPFGTPCPPAMVKLVFECFFSPLRVPPELKSAVDTTYQTSTAVSSVLGNPVTAMSNTGMVSILSLEECVFSDIDPLDASVSPIPFAFGDELGQYYRGGVVVAVAINIGYFALALLTCSVVLQKFIPSTTRGGVLGLLRYPSSVMVFVGMFHQGMASSSVSLLRLAKSPLDMLLGSCGLVAATCLTVFFCLAGTRWRQCHVADRSEHETHSSVTPVKLFLDLALWKQHWVDDIGEDGNSSGYKRRYLFILDDMAVGYWAGVEVMSGLTQGAILGVRKNDLQACRIQRFVLAVHCFLMAAASIIIRPCGSIFGNLFLILSKLGSFVVALFIVIHTVWGSETAHRDAQRATAGFAFISSMQTVVQLLLVLSRKALLGFFWSQLMRWRLQTNVVGQPDSEHSSGPLQAITVHDLATEAFSAPEVELEELGSGDLIQEAADDDAATIEVDEEVPHHVEDAKAARRQARYMEKQRRLLVKFLQDGYIGLEGNTRKASKAALPRPVNMSTRVGQSTLGLLLPQKDEEEHGDGGRSLLAVLPLPLEEGSDDDV